MRRENKADENWTQWVRKLRRIWRNNWEFIVVLLPTAKECGTELKLGEKLTGDTHKGCLAWELLRTVCFNTSTNTSSVRYCFELPANAGYQECN